ncbi:MAG: hypothetical protein N3F09_11135, partial [Bacteroidia bacterium]|nr:hypothetical protein [Bacteroidia bacterium]
ITEIYLPIFNMFGFNFVKCEEFKYITSIVQVETELLNKLNITSINQKEYNAYIFSNGLIEKIKQIVGFFNEDAVNDFITELNNNLLNGILTKYNKNTNIFDTISIGQYLNLKNEEYVLLKFTIDDVDFFQIFNLNLLNLEEYSNINLKTNEIKLEEYYQEDETTSNIKLKILCKIPLKIEVLLDKKNVTIKDLL